MASSPALAQEPRSEWTLSLGVRESRELSRFVDGASEEDRILDNANARLTFSTRTERSRFALFGRLGGNTYRAGQERDRLNFGGGFSWDHQSSSRFRSTLSQSFNRGITTETLSNLGVLVPELDTLAATTRWRTQYQTGHRTSLSTGLSYSFTRFETDEPLAGSQIVLEEQPFGEDLSLLPRRPRDDGELVVPDAEDTVLAILATEGLDRREITSNWATATLGMQHRVSERVTFGADLGAGYRTLDAMDRDLREGADVATRFFLSRATGASTELGASYQIRRSLVIDPDTTIQTLFGGLTYTPRRRSLTLQLFGGASYYQADGFESQITPTANVALASSLTGSTRAAISYRRQFSSSLGFGRTLLIDFVNASLSQDIGGRLTVSARAGASFASDPLREDSSFDATRLRATASFRVLDNLTVGTTYSVTETEQIARDFRRETDRGLWSYFARFTTSWH